MATIPYTRVAPAAGEDMPAGVYLYEWVLPDADDDGQPVAAPQYGAKVVYRTAGSGTYTFQGALYTPAEVSPVWGQLHDPQGTDLATINDSELRMVLEDCFLIRPVSATDGCTVRMMISTTSRR